MAMEIRRTIADAHDASILCVAYNPQRREIFTGAQDTLIKAWSSESGTCERVLTEHQGWVTGLAYAPELRVLFSCSIDGRILVWSKSELLQKEKVGASRNGESAVHIDPTMKGGPLYCLAWDARQHNLVAGANGHIWVYSAASDNIDLSSRDRPLIKLQALLRDAHSSRGIEEPVRAILSTDSGKLFSVGYDRSLCVWDTDFLANAGGPGAKKPKKKGAEASGLGDAQLKKIGAKENCHEGAITAVTFDPDNNWVITGSFDRCVRIWAQDGKKVAEIDGFADTLTGLAYCPATKTLWMSSNSASPQVYDPRSATDITPFLQATEVSSVQQRDAKERIQRLFRINETGELVASTSSRNLVIWRYNPFGACSILRAHTDWVEVLAYCLKSNGAGATAGEEDTMLLFSGGADSVVRRWEPTSRMNPYLYSNGETLRGHSGAVLCALYCEALDAFITGGDDHTIRVWPVADSLGDAEGAGVEEAENSAEPAQAASKGQKSGAVEPQPTERVLREHTDRITGLVCIGTTLCSASWDLSLRLWDLTTALLPEGGHSTHHIENAHDDYILSTAFSPELQQIATASADNGVKLWDFATDSVDSRDLDLVDDGADGFKTARQGSVAAATAAAADDDDDEDDASVGSGSEEELMGPTVHDGKLGKKLAGVLYGHKADVSQVKWNAPRAMWVTGSEDHSVRMWSGDGVQLCEPWLPGDAITALAIDQWHGFIIAATMDRAVRVFCPERQDVLQVHHGHSDAVRCIIHVPERQQYITASWDRTIRVWRSYEPARGAGGASEAKLGEGEAKAALASASAAEGAAYEEDDDEGHQPTYEELHPLVVPACLQGDRAGRGHDYFSKKVATADETKEKRKKRVANEETAAKSVTGLSAKLNDLEAELRSSFTHADKPPSPERARARAAVRGGARQAARAR